MPPRLFERKDFDSLTASCQRCGAGLRSVNIDITANVARCGCGIAYPIEDFVHLDLDLSNPPRGASFRPTQTGFVASATTRSGWGSAIGLIGLVWLWLVWSSTTTIDWGSSTRSGFFLSLCFAAIVLLGTLTLVPKIAMALAGRVVVSRNGYEGSVFEGLGPIGWSRRFSWSALEAIVEMTDTFPLRRRPARVIAFNFRSGQRKHLRFGTLLSDERRWFLLAVLRSHLAKQS